MIKKVKSLAAAVLGALLVIAPAVRSEAVLYDAQIEAMEGKLLFPGDSIYTEGNVRVGPDQTYADLSEGIWSNTDPDRAYRVSEYHVEETGESGLQVSPEGYVVTVSGGVSFSDDGLGDTHSTTASAEMYGDYAASDDGTQDGSSEEILPVDVASYPEGTWVCVRATLTDSGRVFGHWEFEPQIYLEDIASPEISFLMPGNALSVKAVYADAGIPLEEELPGEEEYPEDETDLEEEGDPEQEVWEEEMDLQEGAREFSAEAGGAGESDEWYEEENGEFETEEWIEEWTEEWTEEEFADEVTGEVIQEENEEWSSEWSGEDDSMQDISWEELPDVPEVSDAAAEEAAQAAEQEMIAAAAEEAAQAAEQEMIAAAAEESATAEEAAAAAAQEAAAVEEQPEAALEEAVVAEEEAPAEEAAAAEEAAQEEAAMAEEEAPAEEAAQEEAAVEAQPEAAAVEEEAAAEEAAAAEAAAEEAAVAEEAAAAQEEAAVEAQPEAAPEEEAAEAQPEAAPAGEAPPQEAAEVNIQPDVSSSEEIILQGAAENTENSGGQGSYTLTVVNGSGGGVHREGEKVLIVADWPEDGMEFAGWTSETAVLDPADRFNGTLSMPAGDVTITATYQEGPSASGNRIDGLTEGGEYLKDTKLTFIAVGNGPDKQNPNPGDYQWVPSSYQIGNVSGGWSNSDYTTSMAISVPGQYTLSVTFVKQFFDGNIWKAANETDQKSVRFYVVNAMSVQTGDSTPIVPFIILAAAALAVIVILLFVLKKRR